ncbi:MAG: SURF1 family protein [Candidatus Devosia phytovorans]|uniref:SURF1-like protein n=1 Tax=Candidatus Devosia phytovorans TaxID=3121372 RepID=A0AAJ6B2H4_9HYPH|nr:SURF1 family protein [Devosia sp.]WEK06444.1 MAG: SURF1 family protein [Devosia sp.]
MSDTTTKNRSLTAIWPILVVGLLACAGFAALGVWQVERLAWKNGLVEAVETRAHSNPLDLDTADWSDIDPVAIEYQRVMVNGSLLPKDNFVQAVTALGGGFWVMTPLLKPDGRTLLVNRGFVLPDEREAARLTEETPVTISGLLRVTEPDGGFLRANDPEAGRWFSRDVAEIGTSMGVSMLDDFFIDADEVVGDAVQGGLTVLSFSNNHLVYALTWFALAAFILGALVYVVRDRVREKPATSQD